MATESDNVNSGALGTLVAVGTIAMLGISLVVTALVRTEMADELAKKEVAADRPYRDLVAEQSAQLGAPAAYKDRGKGLVSLPIDRAMELVVSGLVKDPNSATPPPPIGGSGGSAGAAAEAGGSGGMGGSGGAATAEGEGEKPPGAEPKPGEALNKEGEKPPGEEKKEGDTEKPAPPKPAPKPAPAPGTPATPVPAAPAPAPAPAAPTPDAPPNGQ